MAADESAVGYRAWSSTELTYFEENLPAVKVQVQKSGVGTKKVKLQKVNAAKEALHQHVNGLPAVVADMLKTDTHKAESTYTAPQVADFVVDFTVVMLAVINSAVQLPPDVVNRIQAVTNITREAVTKRKGAVLAAASKLVLPGEATKEGWISTVQMSFERTTPTDPDGLKKIECPRCNHRSLVCIRGLSELAGENADRAAMLEDAQKVFDSNNANSSGRNKRPAARGKLAQVPNVFACQCGGNNCLLQNNYCLDHKCRKEGGYPQRDDKFGGSACGCAMCKCCCRFMGLGDHLSKIMANCLLTQRMHDEVSVIDVLEAADIQAHDVTTASKAQDRGGLNLGNFYQEQRALSLLRQTGGGFTLRQRQDAKALLDKPTNVMNIAGNATGVSSLNHKNTGMKYQNNRLSHRVPPSQPGPSSFFSPPSDSNERQFYPNLEESIQLATALSMSEQEQQLRSSNAGIMEVQCEAVENAGKSLFNHAFDGPRAQRGLFTPIKSPGEVSTSTKSDLSYITVMDQSPPVQDHALIEAVEYCKSLAYDAMCENSEDGVILEGYLSLNQTPLKPAIADCAKRAYERANGRKSRRENDEEECDGPEERKKMTRLFGVLSKANV